MKGQNRSSHRRSVILVDSFRPDIYCTGLLCLQYICLCLRKAGRQTILGTQPRCKKTVGPLISIGRGVISKHRAVLNSQPIDVIHWLLYYTPIQIIFITFWSKDCCIGTMEVRFIPHHFTTNMPAIPMRIASRDAMKAWVLRCLENAWRIRGRCQPTRTYKNTVIKNIQP